MGTLCSEEIVTVKYGFPSFIAEFLKGIAHSQYHQNLCRQKFGKKMKKKCFVRIALPTTRFSAIIPQNRFRVRALFTNNEEYTKNASNYAIK